MKDFTRHSALRRRFLKLAPIALTARVLYAGDATQEHPGKPEFQDLDEVRLPSGKLQRDAILKDEYEHNIKDARDLIDLTKLFELDLEKSDANVLSLDLLKKLDDIEKITRRIRGRMRH